MWQLLSDSPWLCTNWFMCQLLQHECNRCRSTLDHQRAQQTTTSLLLFSERHRNFRVVRSFTLFLLSLLCFHFKFWSEMSKTDLTRHIQTPVLSESLSTVVSGLTAANHHLRSPHHMVLPPPFLTVVMILAGWWSVPRVCQVWSHFSVTQASQ